MSRKIQISPNSMLDLYHNAQLSAVAEFPSFIMRWLQGFIDFDMALFGLLSRGPDGSFTTHYGHLFNESSIVVDEWLKIVDRDSVALDITRNPGRAFIYHAPEKFKRAPHLLDFAIKNRHINILGAAAKYSSDGVMAGLSLRRADPGWRFSADESRALQNLLPHVCEAFRINRAIFSSITVSQAFSNPLRGICLFDDDGLIIYRDDGFIRLSSVSFVDCSGYKLPRVLTGALIRNGTKQLAMRTMTFSLTRAGNLNILTVRPTTKLDALTHRERSIAMLYGTGLTYKEIGLNLAISPATARRHIESIYTKLQVRCKADLSFMIQADSAGGSIESLLARLNA